MQIIGLEIFGVTKIGPIPERYTEIWSHESSLARRTTRFATGRPRPSPACVRHANRRARRSWHSQ